MARAAAITRAKVRSEPGTAASSRAKLSWVDGFIATVDKTLLDIPRALSGANDEVAGFFGPIPAVLRCSGRLSYRRYRLPVKEPMPDQPTSRPRSRSWGSFFR